MRKTVLAIMGVPTTFLYQVYPGSHVSWNVAASDRGNNPLFEILLRIHYTPYIEAQLREVWFYEEYAESQGCAAMDLDDVPF